MIVKVVVVGGGWAGCAAALAARKAGACVELIERTDMLLGTGLVGGIMRNNGRYTATEEMIALGGGDLFVVADNQSRHRNIDFPGHKHASLYDVASIEPAVRRLLSDRGINIHLRARVKSIRQEGLKICAVKAQMPDGDIEVDGTVFVDATGTAGPQQNCRKYGNGCVMCIYRCPAFGPRFSICSGAGLPELTGLKGDNSSGVMSGSCKLHKDSLAPQLVNELNQKGVVVVPVPKHLRKDRSSLMAKACQQYASDEFIENLVLLDTGHAKMMAPYYPLEMLRQITGFENARYEDPYAGGVGNSVRFFGVVPCDAAMKAEGLDNVFCAGEKAGLFVGHTEAIVTGVLAGYNAVMFSLKRPLLCLPPSLACGDAIAFVRQSMKTEHGLTQKYTFSGSVYFERMKKKGLYTTNVAEIRLRVEKTGLGGIFSQPVV